MVINLQDKYEILRYLGYKGQELDENMDRLIEESMKEMKGLIKKRYDYKIFYISENRDNLSLGDGKFKLIGNDIKEHLDRQKEFLSVLGAEKSIGLTSTFTSILIPRKSVTAIVGVIDIENKEKASNCLNCNKYSTCIFSKGDEKCGS